MNRREFMGAVASVPFLPQAAGTPEWCDRPMRWAQLTLVENDPGQFDPGFWLNYFRRVHADAACLSAGGCVAFYPTKVPLHYRSKWMGATDPFGALVKGCRDMGMNVIARTDPHAARQDVFDAHPDWIAVDAEGKKRRHWASPDYWVTCALGPYNFEFMTAVTGEIAAMYDIDGIFSNRWDGSGMCYCDHCRTNFRTATGKDLPRSQDPKDPPRRAYVEWRQNRLFELWDVWDKAIRAARPNARFIPNTGGGALSSLDMKRIGAKASILFADRQARRGLMPPWMSGKNGKEYRAAMGEKPIGGIFSVGVEEPYRWKDSVQNAEEIRMWVADATANGLRPWFTKFSGVLRDERWLRTVEEIYNWHWRNEQYLRNERSLARVGLVYSQRTAQYYGGEQARARVEDHGLGWYQALIESRTPFEMVHDELLDPNQLARYRTLILPNIAAMSEDSCRQVRSFAGRGGRVIATFETSLYNEWGEARPDFGLNDLFGASYAGRIEGPMQNSYLTVERDAAGQFHPILRGLEDAPRIINGVRRAVVKPDGSKPAYSPLTLVPSYPDLPMEQVFPRVPHTDEPEVYVREYGQGRIVYFPWDVDRTYWEVLSTDHGKLLRNAVDWATNEPAPVTVSGPGLLDVTIWRQRQSLTVHIVNMTNPMAMKGPVREFYPVGPLEVTIRAPEALEAARVRLLTAGSTVEPVRSNGALIVRVPSVELHEVIALDL